MSNVVRVAAAVIVRGDGDVLLAQRPPGRAYAGYWEFPGGKLEAGESPAHALSRELHEELGITVRGASPWLVQEFVYPHAHVELHFFRVHAWDGDLVGHDGQAFVWQNPSAIDVAPLLPANARVLLNGDADTARALGLAGVHWTADVLAAAMSRPRDLLVAASCHMHAEVMHASSLDVDFVVLGPVLATPTHAGLTPLGWDRFADAVAGTRVPVFALGGLHRDDLDIAIARGAHGIAMRRHAWPSG